MQTERNEQFTCYFQESLIQVRARENDHPEAVKDVKMDMGRRRIYRKYLSPAYQGPEKIIRKAVLEYRVARSFIWQMAVGGVRGLRREFAWK
jgi:hypothetical protein